MDPLVPRMTTRREFARTAALAAVVPLVASVDACAHAASPAPASTPAPEPAPAAAPASPAAAPAPAAPARPTDPAAEALTDLLKARYPDRLTAEQWAEVRRGVEGNLATAKALHDFPLDTAVEPPFAFRPYRAGAR
jgi:hypothetical protein